ncbi:MAG: endopeptidase La [Nitrospirota bacterium]|nr:endopeptidase La [Nitrospirota bacterium]
MTRIIDADIVDSDKNNGGEQDRTAVVVAQDILPDILLILPITSRPMFPGLVVPLVYEHPKLKSAVRNLAESGEQYVGLLLAREEEGDFVPSNLYRVGVAARIHKMVEVQGHGLHLVVECMERFVVEHFLSEDLPLRARVRYHHETEYRDNLEIRAYTVAIINTIKEMLKHNPLHEEELKMFLSRFGPSEPARLADFAASLTSADRGELQQVLEAFSIFDRLKKVLTLIRRELDVSKIQKRIRTNIDEKVSDQERRFFLKQQLHEIQRELGMEEDERTQEVNRLMDRAKGLQFSIEARERFHEELNKLSMLEPSSAEYGVSRNYLDWLTALPWGKFSRDRYDLKRARRELDRDHAGLDDVKDRILEFIAVGARKMRVGGSIILFVGPPGVGKTSVGHAIADAVGRPFYRFSVGGMRDEAEIKGHRRTYIGAMPGKIIQALKQVKAANPVIMIDEVDKIGTDFRGDPASALLEVLDPEQNKDFLDHYLDVRFDLGQVLFLLTANVLDTVPPPLLDRAEIIHLPGYMTFEKFDIGKRHLWPRQKKAHALTRDDVRLSDAALKHLIEDYAREPGVRQLEQYLKKILRKAARHLINHPEDAPLTIGARNLHEWVGKPRFVPQAMRSGVGISTGLAWTAMGGTSLTLEAVAVHTDERGLKLTGQLGKVMQESAEIALSYVSAHAADFGADPDFFEKRFIHLHVPEGAVPKDGPSAGITMATALLSLALNKAPDPLAMTGEMTLTGEVLPIGGVREKLLAAKRLNIDRVILPAANAVDVEELPTSVTEGLKLHYVEHFPDVVRLVFHRRARRALRSV